MKKLKFELYKSKGTRSSGKEPMISIIGRGGFGFNTNFVEKYIPEKPKFLNLTYAQDMDYIYIGFSFSKKEKENALKVYYPKKNGIVLSIGFFKTYGINPEKYKTRYSFEEIEDTELGKLFVIKLRK